MPLRIPTETLKKLQPKLRMIADGDTTVNVVRAERCAGLAVERESLLKKIPPLRGPDDVPVTLRELKKKPKTPALKRITRDVLTNVFVYLRDASAKSPKVTRPHSRSGQIIQVQAPLSEVPKLAEDPSVSYIEIAEALKAPTPTLAKLRPSAPPPSERRFGEASRHKHGADVLIGIIDVQGFDFSHPDFLDDHGKTRFIRIWDQGGDARPNPEGAQFSYGAEFRQEHLNAAIKASPQLGLPATDIERQSQMVEGSHGTHVASIAAGNRGICRKARIAGVLISLPREDEDRRLSFYDSSRLVDAVDYLLGLADELKVPVSINVSLGTNGHSHDGSGAVTRWIDAALRTSGRAVTVAAGNAGQERGETEDDFGWVMGRIHSSGRVPAAGLERDLEWTVVGNGIMDLSENEMEIWFSAQDRIAVSIKPPNGGWISPPVEPREFIQNRMLPDGTMVSVYNEVYHPANGLNCISLSLSPFFTDTDVVGVPAGTWIVRLHAREIRDGRFHAWIERDDPQRLGRVGEREAWAFPSFFTENSLVDDTTVSSLGCANRIITVANYDEAGNRINISSSQGPTRDGRPKPDVAAPGTNIVAAKGFADEADRWLALTGTSMASPYVTGVVGLMLAIEPRLTAAQIEAIVRRTARPLPGASFDWTNDAGFGVIHPDDCLEEVQLVNERKDLG